MHDVVIIGGGPVGLSAALAAHQAGLDAIVLEARREPASQDPRVFALSFGARLILERLGVWARVAEPHPIDVVHISQRGRFGSTTLDARELGIEALGYVVSYANLVDALHACIAATGVPVMTGASVASIESRTDHAGVHYGQGIEQHCAEARIVAQADGGAHLFHEQRTTERDYKQSAVIAEVACERALPAHAYERFTGRGPIALLPSGSAHALIWTVPVDEAGRLVDLAPAAFEQALSEAYGERIGAVSLRGPRFSFKLVLRYAHGLTSDRHVLIGNAAQTLHPVAGQGFNLGLRDAYELAQVLAHAAANDRDLLPGLRTYRSSRRFDRVGGTLFTDVLVRLFSNDDPLLAAGRSLGLFLLDASGAPKHFLMRRMIFGNPG